jgi:hypothetical protein
MWQRRITAALVVVIAAAGCNSKGPVLPAVVPAKGVIQLASGQPIREGRLELSPKDVGGVEAFGDVKSDGSFTLTTYKRDDGAVPGRYVVKISPYNYAGPGGNPVPIRSAGQIPGKYLEAETSKLEVEIKKPDNDLHLRLEER